MLFQDQVSFGKLGFLGGSTLGRTDLVSKLGLRIV